MQTGRLKESVIVACPDARPPAYQAVVGLNRGRLLRAFVTSSYYNPEGRLPGLLRRIAPNRFARLERVLLRRHDPEIPGSRVRPVPSFDLALRLEVRLAEQTPRLKRALARWRTERFDALVARVDRADPARGGCPVQRRRIGADLAVMSPSRNSDDCEHGPRRRA